MLRKFVFKWKAKMKQLKDNGNTFQKESDTEKVRSS